VRLLAALVLLAAMLFACAPPERRAAPRCAGR
jgi:hypothetical protein